MKIVYLGAYVGTSAHRVEALRRLRHIVHVVDPAVFLPSSGFAARLVNYWGRRAGPVPLESFIRERVLNALPSGAWDLAYVDSGMLVGPSLVRELRARCGCVVNYNPDDPYGSRDLRTWKLYLKAVPEYDAVFVLRDLNVAEAFACGAKRVYRLWFAADEVAHSPIELTAEERKAWSSDVLFAGTWMPERGPFLARLLELGVPLSLYGNRWQKAKEWPVLRSVWRGPALESGTGYVKALLAAKVCLGLLSKGNRDQTTTRSFDIPHVGRALCAERTAEHASLYIEGEEAEFWSTPEECAEKCGLLLSDGRRREELAARGRRRCLRNGKLNERVLAELLDHALERTKDGRLVADPVSTCR